MDHENIIAELVKKYTPLYDELTTSDLQGCIWADVYKEAKNNLLTSQLVDQVINTIEAARPRI
jgi:hypothetical protein